jgi:hypothetical protein
MVRYRRIGEHHLLDTWSPAMTRWNITRIVLYSHDGRRRDVEFRHSAVNIITGDSHTGKSAISEIIDYAMGSSECHIPPFIRDRVGWVGVQWSRGETSVFIARLVTPGGSPARDHMHWRVGSAHADLAPRTAAELRETGTRDSVLRQFEEVIGIGDARPETFGADRAAHRVSARQLMPYLLQDDDVIISKTTLLRGAQDERRRGLLDSIPYFLRVSDEGATGLEAELRRLLRQRAIEQRREIDRQRLVADEHDKAFSLITEAVEMGLIPKPSQPLSLTQARDALREAESWTPGRPPIAPQSQLTQLYAT